MDVKSRLGTTGKKKPFTAIMTLDRFTRNRYQYRKRAAHIIRETTSTFRMIWPTYKKLRKENKRLLKQLQFMEVKLESMYAFKKTTQKQIELGEEIIDHFNLLNMDTPTSAVKKLIPELSSTLQTSLVHWRKRVKQTIWYQQWLQSGEEENSVIEEIAAKKKLMLKIYAEVRMIKDIQNMHAILKHMDHKAMAVYIQEKLCPELLHASQSEQQEEAVIAKPVQSQELNPESQDIFDDIDDYDDSFMVDGSALSEIEDDDFNFSF